MQARRIVFFAWSVLLLAALMLIYSPSFPGPYIFDDLEIVEANQSLESFPPNLTWHRPEARAVVLFTFALDRLWWGDSPLGHRIGNVIVHWLAASILAALIYRVVIMHDQGRGTTTTKPLRLLLFSLFAATLWAIHPLNSQAVAYIVQRFESMMGMFFFAYLLAIVLQDQAETQRGKIGWLLGAWIFFVLGIWSKTIMITATAVGPLMDRAWLCSSWREVLRRRGWLYLPPIVIGGVAVLSLVPGLIQGTANVGFGGETGPADLYLAAQAEVIPNYMWQLLYPTSLSLDHGWLGPDSVSQQFVWLVLMMIVIALGVWLQSSGRVRAAFFVLAPLLVLSPSSSLVPTLDLMVEHRMYVPSAIVITGLVWAALKLSRRIQVTTNRSISSSAWRVAGGTLMITIISVYAARTYVRAGDYASGIKIWQLAMIHNPLNPRAAQNMIDEALSAGVQDVIPFFQIPVQSAVTSGKWAGILKGRVAEEFIKRREAQMAIPILASIVESAETDRLLKRRFLRFDVKQELASHRINLAIALSQVGRLDAAMEMLDEAFVIDDKSPNARAIAGEIATRLGKRNVAIDHYQRALELLPDWVEVEASLRQLEEPSDVN